MKKYFRITLPISLMPYIALLTLAMLFFSPYSPLLEFIIKTAFFSNAIIMFAVFFLYCFAAIALSIVIFVISIRKKWDALSIARHVMIIKLIQIPAYILIYVLSVLMFIAIFTIPFTIGLFLFDCMALFASGILFVSAVVNSIRQGVFSFDQVFRFIVLQAFFCVDVVAAIIFYKKLKKASNSMPPQRDTVALS